jgi:uncharacterized repeat protein (TIGR01451 family)
MNMSPAPRAGLSGCAILSRFVGLLGLLLASLFLAPLSAEAQPEVTKSFSVATIPVGGRATLTFDVKNNSTTVTLTNVHFTDTLPAGLVIASPNNINGFCTGGSAGVANGNSGGSTTSLFNTTLVPSSHCTYNIDVTATTAGTKLNSVTVAWSGGTGNTGTATLVVSGCTDTFDFDFSGTEYTDCFRDVLRGGEIKAGLDVGGTGHDSLVFTGSTGSGGATWLTVYDRTPTTPAPGPTFGLETLCADVLFHRFNNIKGAGVVALLNEGVGKRGLALIVSDAGNTDLLRLATVEGDPAKQGKLSVLASVPMKNGIAENVWYRLVMTVDPTPTAGRPLVTGRVFTHSTPLDPDSPLGVQVGTTLTYFNPLPEGVSSPGQNGILAQAVSAVVDLSVTNFTNDPALCVPLVK